MCVVQSRYKSIIYKTSINISLDLHLLDCGRWLPAEWANRNIANTDGAIVTRSADAECNARGKVGEQANRRHRINRDFRADGHVTSLMPVRWRVSDTINRH